MYIVKGTDTLRQDHGHIQRLGTVVRRCHEVLAAGEDVPLDDIREIIGIIDVFLDSIHYHREENSYFPCVAAYATLNGEIRKLLIEHEFSRRIAASLYRHLRRWRAGADAREPVSRYLRTYAIYLDDHMQKEERFFEAATQILSVEEEQEMYEQFRFAMDSARRIDDIVDQITRLENRSWMR